MQSESNETKRENPVEAGPGKIVFFLFRLESLEEIVTGRGSWEGRQGLGLNHGLKEPWAEGFALLGGCGQDIQSGRPRYARREVRLRERTRVSSISQYPDFKDRCADRQRRCIGSWSR